MSDILLDCSAIPAGSTVLCAVSGGADSVCLLSLLQQRRDITVLCAHYNHHLRGEESNRDEAFVKDLCTRWNIPCCTGSGDVAAYGKAHGMGTEEAARELRYAFLQKAAAETGADCIATAHTMNDNAETVLLNLCRGTGLRGLCGIPTQRGNIVRPLLSVTRQQVEAYLRAEGIAWVEDSSNQGDDYARNRVRHHVLPLLEEVHSGALESIARMTDTLREDEVFLQEEANRFLAENPADSLSIPGLLTLPGPVQHRVLASFTGAALNREHRQAVLALCQGEKPSGDCHVPGCRLRREYDRLLRISEEILPLAERKLIPGEELLLPEAGLEICAKYSSNFDRIQSSFNIFYFSCANIYGTLSVTSRREGDSLYLEGRKGSRSVKKWMIEAKIPRSRRGQIPVLRDEKGVLAVLGMGQRAGTLPQGGEPCLMVEIKKKGAKEA